MATQLRNDPKEAPTKKPQEGAGYLTPNRRFPVQQEIQKLQKKLNEFNERIAELEKAGHPDRATEELKANAIDFARQIDKLRCLLVQAREETLR